MAPHRLRVLISSTFSLAVLAAATGQAPAVAEPLPYGPDTCIDGYVWRDGRPGDHVCVTPAVRDATAQQNADGAVNREPNGGEYGPNTCKQGFVWREAFGGDAVCVTPDVRDQARADNAAAESRKLANQPRFDAEIAPGTPNADPGNISGSNHSHYYEDGGESLYNMANIVSGNADRLFDVPEGGGKYDGGLAPYRTPDGREIDETYHVPYLDVDVNVHLPLEGDPENTRTGVTREHHH